MGGAKMFETGIYLQPGGLYEAKVSKLLVKNTRKGKRLFICEMVITKSSNEKDPVGAKRSWTQDMAADAAWSSIKGFMYALLGFNWDTDKEYINAKDPTGAKIESIAEEAVGDTNPLKDRPFAVQTVGTITKVSKQPFTRHDFTPKSAKLIQLFE